MRVTLTYVAPVYVTVDLDEQAVAQVEVDKRPEYAGSDPFEYSPRDIERACEIAEEGEWPAWHPEDRLRRYAIDLKSELHVQSEEDSEDILVGRDWARGFIELVLGAEEGRSDD